MKKTYLDIPIIPDDNDDETLEDKPISYWKKRNRKILGLFLGQLVLVAILFIAMSIHKLEETDTAESDMIVLVGVIQILIVATNSIYSLLLFASSIYSILHYKNKSMLKTYFISFIVCVLIVINMHKPLVINFITDTRMAFSYLPIIYFLLVRYKIRKIESNFYEI